MLTRYSKHFHERITHLRPASGRMSCEVCVVVVGHTPAEMVEKAVSLVRDNPLLSSG